MSKEYSFPAPDAIVLKVNGVILAHASGYEVKAARGCYAVEPFGSTAPVALMPGSLSYTLQLTALLWETPDVDYYTLSNFSVEITRCGKTITFSGCRWTAIAENSRNTLLWETVTLNALTRTEATA